jgi:regulatory protein
LKDLLLAFLNPVTMPFQRPKIREPLTEAGLFEYAVGTLARRMRTVRDLRRLMRNRAEPGPVGEQAMNAVIARLIDLNYLSDTRFAADYTRLRKENEKFGKRRVQQDLMQKGVAKDLIATTLETAYEDVDEVALARAYCAKKRMKQPGGPGVSREDAQKESARIMNRLLRAGFTSNAIFKLLRSWNVEVEETELDDDLPDS